VKITVSLPRNNNFDPSRCEGSLATSSADPLVGGFFTSDSATNLTSRDVCYSSAYEAEADMPNIPADVR
jgi:hypothetical protein